MAKQRSLQTHKTLPDSSEGSPCDECLSPKEAWFRGQQVGAWTVGARQTPPAQHVAFCPAGADVQGVMIPVLPVLMGFGVQAPFQCFVPGVSAGSAGSPSSPPDGQGRLAAGTQASGSEAGGPAIDAQLAAQLERDLDSGAPDRVLAAAAAMRARVLALAMESRETSLLVQKALKRCPVWLAVGLKAELHGHVRDLIKSHHGNHVVQKLIEALPGLQTAVVAREMRGYAQHFARHRFGCRVLSRMVEQHSVAGASAVDEGVVGPDGLEFHELMVELLQGCESLCRHTYAHHVLEAVLEHGKKPHRRRILHALRSDPLGNAKDRYACFVVQAALTLCRPEERSELAADILGGDPTASLLHLAEMRFGARLVESLSKVPCAQSVVSDILQTHGAALAQSNQGRHLQEFGLLRSDAATIVQVDAPESASDADSRD